MLSLTVCGVLVALVSSVAGDCTGNWVAFGTSCYLTGHDVEDWTGAMAMCQLLGGALAEISNVEEHKFVASLTHNDTDHNKAGFWVGLTDVETEGTYIWMPSKNLLAADGYTNWGQNQPDNNHGHANCVWLNGNHNGKWFDGPCSTPKNYICEKDDGTGSTVIG